MGRTSQHYERAFEAYLIGQRIPHVMINDARRAVLPAGGVLSATDPAGTPVKIKSFDAVVYAPAASWDEPVVAGGGNLLVEVKGRRVDLRRGGSGRRESWTTMEDVRSLSAWERLFGTGFEGVLLFWYWLDGPVLNALEPRTFRFEGRTYAHRAVRLADYTRLMRVRSPKWATVNLAGEDYERVGVPLERLFESNRGTAMGGGVAGGGIGGAGGSVAGSPAMA